MSLIQLIKPIKIYWLKERKNVLLKWKARKLGFQDNGL